jgi:hypothetical protein
MTDSNWKLASATNTAPAPLIPVQNHFFTREALDAAVARTIPSLPEGRTMMFAGVLDASGVSTAVVFQKQAGLFGADWTAKAAFEHDWTGDNRAGVSFGVSK